MDDYLSKPISGPEKLEAKIREWLPADIGRPSSIRADIQAFRERRPLMAPLARDDTGAFFSTVKPAA